ncbi:hypothetical protein Vadar_033945 [Vaccinium darrowii]|uniref:Uncharacterized protein n=1 Tax=Vaccinium darrowii TaxID=229202 RepID=A0ACB7YHL1_9ERIC|nr:hypothetical protein Vadar_033945 [Vaccinium darrowii]
MISCIDGRFQKQRCLMKAWEKAHGINSSKDHTLTSNIISCFPSADGIDTALVGKIPSNLLDFEKMNKEKIMLSIQVDPISTKRDALYGSLGRNTCGSLGGEHVCLQLDQSHQEGLLQSTVGWGGIQQSRLRFAILSGQKKCNLQMVGSNWDGRTQCALCLSRNSLFWL